MLFSDAITIAPAEVFSKIDSTPVFKGMTSMQD
jgi:hypothetical protein